MQHDGGNGGNRDPLEHLPEETRDPKVRVRKLRSVRDAINAKFVAAAERTAAILDEWEESSAALEERARRTR